MKADPSAQLLLLDLQAADSTIDQVAHRAASLPEARTVAELHERRAELDGRRVEAQTRVTDLSARQRQADAEVEAVKARRVRDLDRLGSGAITNPKDLESLQREVEALERRIASLEDDELEVMEALEEAQNELTATLSELEALAARIETAEAARDAALGALRSRGETAEGERARLIDEIPGDLLALYERLRGQYDGVGAAAVRARSCEGCRLELNAADVRELAGRPDDDVVRCPECSRILVRTAESGL